MTDYGSPVWPDNHTSNDLDIEPTPYQIAEEKRVRIEENIAKQLQRSIEINSHLRTALGKAADALEAKGLNFAANDARRALREL